MKGLVILGLLTLQLLVAPIAKAESNIYVTAYNLTGKMANGQRAHYGAIACPIWMQLGRIIIIYSFGAFECSDRYDNRLSDRFDISMPAASITDCYAITGWYAWAFLNDK